MIRNSKSLLQLNHDLSEMFSKTMAAIGQGVVVEAPCVVLEVVAAEQVLGGHKFRGCSLHWCRLYLNPGVPGSIRKVLCLKIWG
jgi:hypothetical protein